MTAAEPDAQATHFETLFRHDADPWGTRTRWYERRKRGLMLAALPHERYRRAFEPGCGAGETTLALSARCHEVVASDASKAAVMQAQARIGDLQNVRLVHARIPCDWPAGAFDLVVLSELGYYLAADDLGRLARKSRDAMQDGGTLVACHWRHAASDLRLSAQYVHSELDAGIGFHRAVHYEDADFLLDVWTTDQRSVATLEGLA